LGNDHFLLYFVQCAIGIEKRDLMKLAKNEEEAKIKLLDAKSIIEHLARMKKDS